MRCWVRKNKILKKILKMVLDKRLKSLEYLSFYEFVLKN